MNTDDYPYLKHLPPSEWHEPPLWKQLLRWLVRLASGAARAERRAAMTQAERDAEDERTAW